MERILYITEAFGGGVFVVMTHSCNILASRGYDVHLCYSHRWDTLLPLEKYLDPRVMLHYLPMVRNIHLLYDVRSLIGLRKLFKKLSPDVIHLYSSKAGFLGRVATASLGKRIPVFYSPQGLAFLQKDFSRFKRGIFIILENLASLGKSVLIACSQTEEDMAKKYLPFAKVKMIENAIDVGAIKENKNDHQRLCIGTVGRIKAQKDPLSFATLAKKLANRNASFVWIGDGDHPGKESLRAANVEITGMIDHADCLERLAGLDIYIQTSLWEGMPFALIEALIAGIPAVVTDVIGNRDVVDHGETGFIARSLEDMVGYTNLLLEDNALRKKMGAEARQRSLHRFNFDRFVNELLQVYNGNDQVF